MWYENEQSPKDVKDKGERADFNVQEMLIRPRLTTTAVGKRTETGSVNQKKWRANMNLKIKQDMLNKSADAVAGPSLSANAQFQVSPADAQWGLQDSVLNPPQANTWVDLDSRGIGLWGTQSSGMSSVLFELCLDFLIGPLAISRCNVLLTPKRTDGPRPTAYWKDEAWWEHPGEVWLWKMCYICIRTTAFLTFTDSEGPRRPSQKNSRICLRFKD